MRLLSISLILLSACTSPPTGPISAKIIGHGGMGANSEFPTNSMESIRELCTFKNAGHGVTGVEVDVQMTSDNDIVLFHDQLIEVNRKQLPVRAFPLKDLPKRSDDGKVLIPRYMDAARDSQCSDMEWFLDVKLFHHQGDWDKYLETFASSLGEQINAVHAGDRTVIECQVPGFLVLISATCPDCRLFFYAKNADEIEDLITKRGSVQWASDVHGVSVHYDKLDQGLAERIRNAGLALAVFGCSGMSANSSCAALNPTYIQTENVEMVCGWK